MREALGSIPSVSTFVLAEQCALCLGVVLGEKKTGRPWLASIEDVTAVGFEPTPLRTGALSQRLRPLGQTVR